MSTCDDIETGLRQLAADDNLATLEAELSGHAEYEVIDGYRIGPDGEVLEFVGEPRFAIDSESAAEWVLEKRQDEESRIVALKAKREAILANLGREIKHHEGRVRALDYRFAAELEAFARTRLSGKRRTWTCPYGSVAFRHTKARWTWSDAPDAKERAVRWAKENWTPELIAKQGIVRTRLEEVPVLDAITRMVETLEKSPGGWDEVRQATWTFLSYVPEGETVKIETGVK